MISYGRFQAGLNSAAPVAQYSAAIPQPRLDQMYDDVAAHQQK
jgi:hypothetical protein